MRVISTRIYGNSKLNVPSGQAFEFKALIDDNGGQWVRTSRVSVGKRSTSIRLSTDGFRGAATMAWRHEM